MSTLKLRLLVVSTLFQVTFLGCGTHEWSAPQAIRDKGEAVVFIPSIASTNLIIDDGNDHKSLDIFDAIRKRPEAVGSYLDPFKVNENGSALREASPKSLAIIYTMAANQMRKEGVTVYEFGYDWRKNLTSVAQDLESYINRLPHKKVNLLSMSLGGLIAAKYIEHNASKVDKFISLGTPFLGSTKSLQFLLTGGFLGAKGQKAEEFRKFMKSVPPLYESLPGRRLSDITGHGPLEIMVKDQDKSFRGFPYFQDSWQFLQATDRVNPKVLQDTSQFIDGLDYERILSSVRTYFVVGDGIKTIETLQIVLAKSSSSYKVVEIKYPEQNYVSGDDTTTLVSATIGGLATKISPNRVYYLRSPHINLMLSRDVLIFITRLTMEGTEEPVGKMRLHPFNQVAGHLLDTLQD
jgi:pimeloyl-ACP methyl ester carboxylesterase